MDRDDKILAYLQGKLSSTDHARFEDEMAADATLAGEVAVMRSVQAELAEGPKMPDPDQGWTRLLAAINEPARPANENRRPWLQVAKYAAVASVAIAVWQVAAVPRLGAPQATEPFRAATETSDAVTLQVKFADGAQIEDIVALLEPLGATLTGGPSALGIIRVSFQDDDMRQQALVALEARTDLVEFALEQ